MDGLSEFTNIILSEGYDADRVRLFFVALLALMGFSLAFALSILVNAFLNPVKKRIDKVQNDEHTNSAKGNTNNLLQRIGVIFIPKAEKKRSKIASQLETAGYRSARAISIFYGIKLISFILTPFLFLVGIVLFTNQPVLNHLGLAILVGVSAFFVPDFWLNKMVKRRKQQLRHALPDALDLMVVCAEAGLGLNAAIKRVADEIGVQHPELADEFQLVMMQTRAGMDNRAALKELERRTGLGDISAFVTTLLQALRFGTSIGQSLRVFSDEMRDKRLQRAQEKAARLSLTMLFPIVLCMLPMFFLIVLGPALLTLSNTLTKITGP